MSARVVALLALGALIACSHVDQETQITVAITSETEIPTELDAFSLRVLSTRTGEVRLAQDYYPTNGRDLPATLAVIPLDEGALGSPVRVEVEGRKGGVTILSRQSIVSYVEGRNLLLALPLRMACFQSTQCGETATCIGGECRDAKVDAQALEDYRPGAVFGAAGACFDEEACLGTPVEVAVAEDCTFPFDLPAGRGNVAIRWSAAPARLLALEAESPLEGFTRVEGGRARLSQGLCDSYFQRRDARGELLVRDRAEKVYVATACASKTVTQPYCFSARTQHAGIGAVIP